MSGFDELSAECETAHHWRDLAERRQKLIHELAALANKYKDEAEGLRKDAERYRSMFSNAYGFDYHDCWVGHEKSEVDAMIDAAQETGHV